MFPASGEEPVERLVMLRGAEPFKVIDATIQSAKGEVGVERISDTKTRLRIKVEPASIKNQAILRIGTTHPPVIEVPLRMGGK